MSISLVKGQKISLDKSASGPLRKVVMGLGWDITPGAGQVDLDASCATFDGDKNPVDVVYFAQRRNASGSVQHSGDNLTGAGEGDDEQIVVELDKVDSRVQAIVFTVTSFRGQQFTLVKNAFVRAVNGADGKEICRYNLSGGAASTGMVMARVYRHNGEWKIAALGDPLDGKTIKDLLPHLPKFL